MSTCQPHEPFHRMVVVSALVHDSRLYGAASSVAYLPKLGTRCTVALRLGGMGEGIPSCVGQGVAPICGATEQALATLDVGRLFVVCPVTPCGSSSALYSDQAVGTPIVASHIKRASSFYEKDTGRNHLPTNANKPGGIDGRRLIMLAHS